MSIGREGSVGRPYHAKKKGLIHRGRALLKKKDAPRQKGFGKARTVPARKKLKKGRTKGRRFRETPNQIEEGTGPL
jgi:hypothetical protein